MATFFEFDEIHVEFGEELCEKFQKFLRILYEINYLEKINFLSITIFDDGFSNGIFDLHFNRSTLSFNATSNVVGYSLRFGEINGMTGEMKSEKIQDILSVCGNFSTTVKKPRYEVFEKVMNMFCDALNIKFNYFCK